MKETHYKLRHRVTVLIAAAVMLCSMLPGAAFAEETEPQPTEEVVQMEQQTEPSETDNGQADESSPDPGAEEEATPKTAEEQPAEEEISAAVVGAELYADLPDAPIGSYIGSEGLPVATGHTKIGISEWPESQLEEISGSYLTADALDSDGLTMTAPLLDGADYAVVPIMAQVEYPADGSSTDIILPDGVTVLDFYGAPAADADTLLHSSYYETSAAVMGLYVQAADDFSAQLVYTDPNGDMQTKTLNVTIDREHTVASPFADAGIAAYGERPIPDVTNGKITKVAKVNGTWLIWFNGDEAYCCTPGADGQPKNCPTYTYVDTSMVGADQYVPGDHYGNQFRIWGGLTQLSLGMQELPPVALSAEAPSLLDFCRTIYTDAQMQIIENYPDSTAAKILMGSAQALLEGTDAYASARGYYTYIYQPGRAGWQTVAVIGPEISDDEPNPKPIVQEIYANWQAPAQTASGSFDFNYGIITDKVQLKTNEKVDGATIEIEPITKSGTIDGGTWAISPADKQTVTTSGHTDDNNYQNNGGAASASWTLHYSVSKTTDSRSGRVGPYTTQDEADAAADSARDSAIAELQGEAQRMVDNAMASAKAELASIKFRYEEVGVPYGFEMYWGSNGSKQTISVPANSNNAYQMKNDEWSLQVNVKKTDSETGNQIAADAQYEIFQWDVVTGKYQPTGGYNTYSIQRQNNGTYAVINSAAYATTDSMRHTLYYTQRNMGKFVIAETKAPNGYFGDWTNIDHPGTANTPLGKRGYYIEITEDKDNSVIWLDNADYNADIAVTDMGGTKLVTSAGVETTVTIYDTAKDPRRTYNTDNSGKAANEDNYIVTPTDGVMKNDRTLGEISISKVDLDAVRYVGGKTAHDTALASGQGHGDATLDGAVYDLYAAEDITHPDGVTGVVDYSKIVDANGNPVWHTMIRDNSGQWVSDYLPILKKDHLVASAKIENGWLTFANLYLGKYYVVERSTGVVIPLRDGALAVSGTYPTVDSRTKAATGQTAALAKDGSGQYTDWVYKNQFSTVSKGKALDGSWTYDAYYLSFADGYLCDEHNYYITPSYDNESWYVEKTTFADNRQAAGEQIDKTSYSANYHIHADNVLAESQDQVAKGNVEISKIVSSSGQSNGLELENAGFTFYLVSDLSKLEQFEQTRSGSYTLQSILDAYIDKNYDNEHRKWDFSAEPQAIAKTYEVNAAEIAAYNKTLTAAGENKNGKGEGWQPTGNSNEYQLAEIFSNDTGNIRVQGLPYGTYLVVETTVPHDLFQAEPFLVSIDPAQDNNPWGAMATPKDSVMTGSDSYQKFTVLDEEIEVYLRITKIDEETGKPVLLPDTAFQIYWLDEQGHYRYDDKGNPKLVTMTDTINGHLTKDVSTFYTNAEGILTLPEKLPLGKYRIVEVSGPDGFRNRKDPWQEIILSQNIRLSNDSYQHQRNLHVVVIGGSGSGKTRFFVKPNALQCSGSYFFLDPKGELTYCLGGAMERNGVTVTVIDFVHFRGHYNPVAYLKTDEDAMKLAYALVFNTKKNPAASGGENEFWDKSAVMFLASLILYILYESPLYERNLNTMMDMILECKVSEDSYDENRMDILFGELEQRDPHHPAVLQYRSFKLGSAKTLSSIMVTAVSNLHMLQSAAFAEMIATDEMFLPKLGVEKRAIFCVIPDNDDTFNFMVSILYTQLFDQLFRLADSTPEFHGTLPVHVRLMMDEFANVATPENFVKILAVARSRNISCDIILQNISQIKSKYKDDWETIIGNCDSLVYLGGNDYSTFEYISKLLGKQTIRTKGQSIGKGSHGSSSDSYQVTGRELMTPDEVRRMKRSDCLVMISGEAPVRDKKYNLFDHPNLKYTPDYRSPRGLLHRAATPIPAPEGYTMPPDYMAQAGTVSLAYVAELTCPEITEDLYDELQEWEESLL